MSSSCRHSPPVPTSLSRAALFVSGEGECCRGWVVLGVFSSWPVFSLRRDLCVTLPLLDAPGGCPRRRCAPPPQGFPNRKTEKMFGVKAWAEYIVEWAAKDPYDFLASVIFALTPLFVISAALPWKLAKMIEAREREQKKKQKHQENIAKAKRTKKD
ncbi:small integral membrane protein 15 isoform X1 [Ciconia boyciana]|uniref:small integral membrane protein 15 isoform X1 n=2 Tax=Ciconia boyciana TaxID=52775 RepID=UPI003BA0AE2B